MQASVSPSEPVVMVSQPTDKFGAPGGDAPVFKPPWIVALLEAIVVMVCCCCCCCPCGLAGLILSIMAKTQNNAKLNTISFWLGLGSLIGGVLCYIFWIIYMAVSSSSSTAAAASSSSSSSGYVPLFLRSSLISLFSFHHPELLLSIL